MNPVKKVGYGLRALPPGSVVGVVSLAGSLCPVTSAHVECLVEARNLLLNQPPGHPLALPRPSGMEQFDAVVGFLSCNSDDFVGKKMTRKGEVAIPQRQRIALVEMATKEYEWLAE
eukprot:RCo050388